MDKQYDSKKVEEKIYKLWEESGFFNPDNFEAKRKEKFSMVIPPPNVTGNLHMGHALNATISDILVRWKRMQGFKTLWVPGTDHAGIATQNVVEKKLKEEGKTRFDLGRGKFLDEVWAWKEKYGNLILEQLKKLGSSCDWSRSRFTMDKEYSRAVLNSFVHYFNKGWIYRGERVVNWCPRCQTSLSDLELEYQEEKGNLWYIKYPIISQKSNVPALGRAEARPRAGKTQNFVIVATTRPETMLGDTAVAVNPGDERYRALIGQKVTLPLAGREIPIIADSAVDKEFGTGAVKVTPAHDVTDFQIGQRNNLQVIAVIDENAKMKSVAKRYLGLKTREARKKIIEDLKAQNLIEKTEGYIHQVPKCYRCGSTVELILSLQWFLKMEELAKLAIEPLQKQKIKFHPPRWENIYLGWLGQARDWCISRQIWWGHRLPVWFCANQKEKYFVSIEPPKRCEICGKCEPEQSQDVFDTWFSSALWPFVVLGWPEKTEDLEKFYPTDILCTARDIINLWVARMVFSGMELTKDIPFSQVIIHSTVMTKEGKRMSKSLGTGIDPIEMIEKYGADSTRFGLAWQASEAQDMKFGEGDILAGKKFCNKIWNASRFVLAEIGEGEFEIGKKPEPIGASDKEILAGLEKTIDDVQEYLEQFRFDQAIQGIYHFFWHQFCDKFIEKAKEQLRNKTEAENTKIILIYVLANCLKLLHPFIPFVTEQIYQLLPLRDKKALIIESWPEAKL